MYRHLKTCVLAVAAPLLLVGDYSGSAPLGLTIARQAAAIVGAPVSPVSVAGVARRTTRRTVAVAGASSASASTQQQQATAQQQQAVTQQQAATAQQQAAVAKQQDAVAQQQAAQAAPAVGTIVSALPAGGCTQTPIAGVEYQKCGNTFYRAAFQGNNLVYVVQKP